MRLILEEYTDGYTDQVKEIYKYGEEVPVKVEYRKPENAEDNIRIYVPLDINKQAVVDCQVKLTHFFVESCPTLAADKVGVLRWVNSICQS